MQSYTKFSLLAGVLAVGLQGCSTIKEHVCEPVKAPEKTVAPAATKATSAPAHGAKSRESVSEETKASSVKTEVHSKPATAPAPIKGNVATSDTKTEKAAAKPAAKPAAPKAENKSATPAKSETLTREQALVLAGKSNCLICHKVDSKLVGPAWKDVGAKYKGDANAAATIAANIKKGGSFGWKIGSMPPKGAGQASDADIANLAAFIASLK